MGMESHKVENFMTLDDILALDLWLEALSRRIKYFEYITKY